MFGFGHVLVGLGMLLFWAGVIVLAVWAFRSYVNRPGALPPAPPTPLTPRQILDERLARGETTVADYEKARAALEKNP
ncbi:MAG: SHOCT domain-containing protein [Candidatus Dormibacteraeota bacterium]|nr:SHOCT domain-containing protein [Candidatus Dormibacteraeota bacterium]